ncbi:MAG: phosphoribosylformylglycinamidine synthase I [Candidatus Methanomethyliaceae archaeon]|nr:phosphoribosylformylglycinamidine synthase I [Candidatus Methanomethyliaceae archaeon]MDW7971336.1 phosphoribosylformylglycinamidine synthase I [Nitrososphaerota archaeon]
MRACIARVGGTNCDLEMKIVLEEYKIKAEIVHMKRLIKEGLRGYDILVFPGGFSYGDYVRAGAIWGKEILAKMRREIEEFIESNKLIIGICNGFQVLVEAGVLPDDGISEVPKAVLATNISAKYECRWIYLRVEDNGEVLRVPIGHGEGRFMPSSNEILMDLIKNRCIIFRYAKPSGELANGEYPYNPNGSIYDIAGICNKKRNIFGMMPHPERAFFGWQMPDNRGKKYGDGKKIFDMILGGIIESHSMEKN